VCPIDFHLLFLIFWIIGFSFAICQRYSSRASVYKGLQTMGNCLCALPSLTSMEQNCLSIGLSLSASEGDGDTYSVGFLRKSKGSIDWG
jgi:hypothetical protein